MAHLFRTFIVARHSRALTKVFFRTNVGSRAMSGLQLIALESRRHTRRGDVDKPFAAYKGEEPSIFVCCRREDEDVNDPIKGASNVLYYTSESSVASEQLQNGSNGSR